MAIIIEGVDLERDCKGCLSCIFHWNGDSMTYCLAQSVKPFRLHRINYLAWEEISKECTDAKERYNKQMEWKEPTCPLKEVPGDYKEEEYCKYCKHRNDSREGVICRHCYLEPRMYEYGKEQKCEQ